MTTIGQDGGRGPAKQENQKREGGKGEEGGGRDRERGNAGRRKEREQAAGVLLQLFKANFNNYIPTE